MEEAKIVIWLLDAQPTEAEIEDMKEKNQGKKLLLVFNKIDEISFDKAMLLQMRIVRLQLPFHCQMRMFLS